MAAISTHVYTSIRSYWRRRAYQRLEGAGTSKKTVRLGGDERRRRPWKVGALKKVMRIRVRTPSPKKLLMKLRDAYINGMLVIAGGMATASKNSSKKLEAAWGKRIPKAREVNQKSLSDFEARMIMHIYNTVMYAPRELTSCV